LTYAARDVEQQRDIERHLLRITNLGDLLDAALFFETKVFDLETGTMTRFELTRTTSKSSSFGSGVGVGFGVGLGVGAGGGGGKSRMVCPATAGIKKKRASTPQRSAGPTCFPQVRTIIKPFPTPPRDLSSLARLPIRFAGGTIHGY
jgi:hypothetical protein